jgi:hypothetical protein
MRHLDYVLSNNKYTEGIRRILTAAYFSATKIGKFALLQTDKNWNYLLYRQTYKNK